MLLNHDNNDNYGDNANFIFEPPPNENHHRAFKKIWTKNSERDIQLRPMEFIWMIVASPSKENRHHAFIVQRNLL